MNPGLGAEHGWVHAPVAAAHDFIAGSAGDFAAVRAAAAVSTLLVRSNLRVIGEMAAWLRGRGIRGWRIVVPAGPVVDGVTPRLAVALPYALQALVRAEQAGIAVRVEGAPHCLLGPYRGRGRGAGRAYAAVCAECPARVACPGVEAAYLERFGAGELSPRALRPATEPPGGRDLLFGTGRGEVVAGSGDMSEGAGSGDVVVGSVDMSEGTGPDEGRG